MALPTELNKIRDRLSVKAGKTPAENNLLSELNALNGQLLTEDLRKVEANVTKMTSPGGNCPCCGR